VLGAVNLSWRPRGLDVVGKRAGNRAAKVVIGTVMVALTTLVGRLVYINAHNGQTLLARGERQQKSVVPLKARRGLIVDSQGRIIAGTILRQSVFADPKVIPDKKAASEQVAAILGSDAREINNDLIAAGDRRFFVLRRGVTDEQAERIRQAGVYGLGVFDEPARTYPMNSASGAIIGFVSPDGVGVSGLEHQCDEWLAGANGVKTIIRDAGRKAFWLADGGFRPARDGLHVVLTIDTEIQIAAERAVEESVKKFEAESGIAVVMHAKSGAILAMVNSPGFDPNHYGDYGPERYRNRAITDPVEPGSTFKPFIMAGALADKTVSMSDNFDCERGLWRDGKRLLHDHHPYGVLSLEDVMVKSSNIGMAKIGKRMGARRLFDYVTSFGFGQRTGIDLLGEDPGIVRPFSVWNDFSVTSIPMGQEIGVTPLQMTRAFACFANGGILVQPHVIRAVLAADGRVLSDFSDPPAIGRVIPEDIANLMKRDLLTSVIRRGTGTAAALTSHQVFGKTGTAQIAKRGGGGYEKNAYVGSFIGAAPQNDPQLVVFVAIRKPNRSKGYYGGTVAAPVAREIFAHALAYLQVPGEKIEPLQSTALTIGPPTD